MNIDNTERGGSYLEESGLGQDASKRLRGRPDLLTVGGYSLEEESKWKIVKNNNN